ncbi:Sulfite reductase [NADPH] subunit beta [Psilocybe cubensis]|uniref:Sulfite reductase [NADPH] subunit beta n=2 Tax=Psilocybe cubensis TaxID=181762 RepID=A0ACB8GVA8_PSICU|nr:Sulfite reductase [NADPH] subunit beta [Psilocybe cubensis]KAH9479673.1 Sulfite reductase [NADPH] subunit beta [Psilocybe cubensis]
MDSTVPVVARIAYLTSDVVVDSLPPPPVISQFAQKYNTLSRSSTHKARVISSPFGADSASTLLRYTANLTSFTASATSQVLTRLVLQLGEISTLPIALHLAVQDDLSDVLLLRSAVPFFLLSTTAQQAHDNALLAARLARLERKAVVHAFYNYVPLETPDEVPEEKIYSFLVAGKRPTTPRAANGHVTPPHGQANGHYTNGHSTNGHIQVHASSEATELFKHYESAALETLSLVRRPLRPWTIRGSSEPDTIFLILGKADLPSDIEGVSFISLSLVNPIPYSRLLHDIPPSVTRVVVLEQVYRWHSKWTPLYLDVVTALQERQDVAVQSAILGDSSQIQTPDVIKFIRSCNDLPSSPLALGPIPKIISITDTLPHVPKHEAAYTKILAHLFNERLEIANSPHLVASQGEIATTPEYALGRVRGQLDSRSALFDSVQELLQEGGLDEDLHSLLSKWALSKDDAIKSRSLGKEIIDSLESKPLDHPAANRILALREFLPSRSRWIIGSDAWSYDLGSSGLHHAIASGLNVNILILDTLPYSSRNNLDPHRRKHDVGLYAMNHGDVFVASVAVFSSYAQVLQAFAEADRFNGPSVVLAYLPYQSEDVSALEILKETKLAVDTGYWPLYRWDPSKEQAGKEPFSLDSDAIKNDLKAFLDRQNHLSQLVRSTPQMAADIVSSLGETVREARKKRAEEAYNTLLNALDSPPLLILYASDGGAAEKKAKRLANRAKARGLSTTIATLDTYTLDTLAEEEHVVFVTSTAGQGEPPQNGRTFFKALNAAALAGSQLLSKVRYSVFAMGDSHYWPRPEDAHYYNKPGKDLDSRLEKLGAERIVNIGLGDDQDADGSETGYKVWEPLLWKALGVDSIEVTEAEPEPITNEHIKAASGYLRGTIAEGLEDFSTGALAPSDGQLTKFHGIYQQDDRDIREEREAQGVEPAYSFMIRVRMPGGVCKPHQWLQMDQIADEHGCGTFKITTRSTFQFHGVIKRHLKPAIQDINRVLLDTLAACGDVNRNVICSSIPTMSKLHAQVYEFSKEVSEHLIPRTTAYHEIWLDKKLVAGEALKDFEPLYGEFYLPRKFKIAVAVPPTNDVDVFANDLGFIAIVGDDGELQGFNVSIGGGMGVTHGNKKTYPRAGSIIGFCTPEQGKYVAEKVMLVQRDNGNRTDRKNARLKYTIDRMGLDVYKAEVEKLLGYNLQPERPYTFDRNVDDFGWHTGSDGKHHFTVFIENGRIQDEPGRDFKTGLREIAKVHKGTFRLTANQHLLVSDVADEDLEQIKELLRKYKLDNLDFSGLRLSSSACVAFPTCGLAMAESERYLPVLIDKVEKICEENGLRNDSIVMRMTGCPNGCARPYLAEIAFVGKAPGNYAMLLGGGYYGQRLNKIYRESVTEPEILAILRPMIKRYALERLDGERFGDFTIRAGYIAPTTEGRLWYENAGGEGLNREGATVVVAAA